MKILLIIIFSISLVSSVHSQGSVTYKSAKIIDSLYSPAGRISAHEFYKDGVPFSSGGGDVYLGNRQTYTASNTFIDTLKASGKVLFDSANIGILTAGYLRGSGEDITDLSADNIIVGNLTDAVLSSNIPRKNGRNTFAYSNYYSDTLKVSGIGLFDSIKVANSITANYVIGSGEYITNIVADNIALGNLTDAVLSANVIKYSSFDTAYVAFLNQQNTFAKYTLFSDSIRVTGMARFDSAIVNGNITVGSINGEALTEFARREEPNTFNGENVFSTETYFNGATVFSELVTMTADLIVSWIKNQSSVNAYKYEKSKIVAGKLPSTNATTFTVAHGITDWHTIKSYTCRIMEDSSNVWVTPGLSSDAGSLGNKSIASVWVDSLYCGLRVPASNAQNLLSDSVFFYLTYTDFSR